MGLFSKDIATFDDLFLHGLQDIYYAENQILKALPKLIDAATNPQLQRGLKDHLKETEGQIARLQQIFEMREESPKGTRCPGINGLISEGDSILGDVSDTRVLDAAIIGSAQAVEHYEITRYQSLMAWAREMGRKDFADILGENLAEEVAANERLSSLGQKVVNKRAAGKPAVRTTARRGTPKKSHAHKAVPKKRARKSA